MSNPMDPNQPPAEPADPQEPQNPYGSPTPPSAPEQSPYYGQPGAPSDPSATEPPQQPAAPEQPSYGQPSYGQPAQPAYGQPAQPAYGQPAQPAQPAYGQPGAPAYGQQPYGQPGYPGSYPMATPGAQGPASKGLAIASLVLGIIGCGIITAVASIVLGVIVLVRSKDGRNHGKGLAIAGIVLSVLWLIGLVALIVVGAVVGSSYSSINDLDQGTCITASGLSDSGDTVSQIKTVGCSKSHDGEVLATHTLSSSEASGYGNKSAATLCQAAVSDAGKISVVAGSINVIGLTQSTSPDSGDTLACVAFNTDGSKLTGTLG